MKNIDNEFDGYGFYLTNTNKLINDINNKLVEYDIEFLIKLGNVFSTLELDDYNKELVNRYNDALSDSVTSSKRSIKFDSLDINGDNILVQVLKRLLYNYSYDNNGLIINKRRKRTDSNYNNLKNIIKFIIEYDNEYMEKYGIPSFIFSSNCLGRLHNTSLMSGQTRMHIR